MEEENKKPPMSVFSLFLFCMFLFFTRMAVMAQNGTVPVNVNVGVVINFATLDGKRGLSCINMALSDLYASNDHYKTRLLLSYRDSKRDVVGAAAAALDLIKNVQVQAILGPESSMQANFVIELGQKAQVPIVTFSATSPSLTSIRSEYFIRATQNDSSQVKAISAIVQAFGWREAVLIYVDNEYGEGIIPYLIDALEDVDTRVPYRSVIQPNISDDEISKELHKLMTMQTRVFIVHMLPSLGSRLFTRAKENGMMTTGYVWIMTDGITNQLSSLNSAVTNYMQGVLGVRTRVPNTKELQNFRIRWKRKFQQDYPTINAELDILGLWAHDAAVALAMAVEMAGTTNFTFRKQNGSSMVTDLETFGVSQDGPKLLQALSSVKFRGLDGDFRLVNGQLQSPVFEIVNINGNGLMGIGFWTTKSGLVKKLSMESTSSYSTSKANLGTIIWPGDSTSVPKGWEIPTNGKKLRIGVPKKDGFSEFVNVKHNPSTNTTSITGYCIDVFKAVMETLPYVVPYELIPFEKPDGQSAGSYNDLVYQVYLQNFDAVVGDTTIVANRSQYVDFTLPYTESGVSMIVPIKEKKRTNAWVFLKPLTPDLWATSACFFVFIGFIVWVFEHRINPDFRGPPLHQVGTSFWFSFSIMVFAHREQVVSNLARFVVIIWCFVVLILTQSYTASLASLLTVQQLQPTVTDVNQLVRDEASIGYNNGSFLFGILIKLGFHESKTQAYESQEDLTHLFSNGTIAAAFDEIPYLRIFLARNCSKYTMIKPTFKTSGFGFVFPKGSPLVPDVSRAILNVTEGEKMEAIERAWLGPKISCPDSSTLLSSNSLGLQSFWGLFLVTGIAASLALVAFTVMFLYEHRNVLMNSDPVTASVWSRIVVLLGRFDKKDLTSFTFRRRQVPDIHTPVGMFPSEASASASNLPESPSSHSNQNDSEIDFFGDQDSPPAESDHPNHDHDHGQERPTTSEIVHETN